MLGVCIVLVIMCWDKDLDKILNLWKVNSDPIKDVQFIYEGRTRDLRVDLAPEKTAQTEDFQGLYALRPAEGDRLLDLYHHPLNPKMPMRRSTDAVQGTVFDRLLTIPDNARFATDPVRLNFGGKGGVSGALWKPGSAERFFLLAETAFIAEQPHRFRMELGGWETVDDRRALLVKVDAHSDQRSNVSHHLWVDMEHGGVPIRVEMWWNDHEVKSRTHSIQVREFPLDSGRSAWLPISGIVDALSSTGETFIREDMRVVSGSLQINRGLRDVDFRIDPANRLLHGTGLSASQRLFDEAAKNSPRKVARRDPQGVAAALEAQLAEARRQATELEASSVAQVERRSLLVCQLVLGSVGVALLIAFGVWKARSA